MGLCENLREARKRVHETQLTVSKNIGISNTALSNYEMGYRQPDLETLRQLAAYYGVSIDALLETMEPPDTLRFFMRKEEAVLVMEGRRYSLSDEQKEALLQAVKAIIEMNTTTISDVGGSDGNCIV